MSNCNLHIYPSDMLLESRIFKEASSIIYNLGFEKAVLLGIWENGLPKEEQLERNIEIKRVYLFDVQKRSILYLYYFLYSFFYILFVRPQMINIHTLEFLPLCLIGKLLNLKVVYDTHELETEKCNLHGFRKKISKIIERLFIKKVDLIFVVSENISKWYANEYNIPKPKVVLNAPKLFAHGKRDLFRQKLGIRPESRIVLYQGGLAKGRGIELLVEAFKKRIENNLVVVFMGAGELSDEIKEASNLYSNIYYYDAVSPEVVLNYTSSGDIGISLIENVCLSYYYCMPNKLFEYAMGGLPVVVSNMKEMRRGVLDYNMGIVVKNNTVEDLNNSLDELLTLNLDEMKENAIKFARDNCWEIQEEKMLKSYSYLFPFL